jgi:hypothetical protein
MYVVIIANTSESTSSQLCRSMYVVIIANTSDSTSGQLCRSMYFVIHMSNFQEILIPLANQDYVCTSNQDLGFYLHMVWFFLFQWSEVRSSCSCLFQWSEVRSSCSCLFQWSEVRSSCSCLLVLVEWFTITV